ncbi:RDD family protein [Endozoicomonadaceae bacterium StTr2]
MSAQSVVATESENFPPASLWRRIAAIVYDTFLVAALMMMVSGLYHSVVNVWLGGTEEAAVGFDPFLFLILLITVFSFFTYFWRAKGQTLGMQVWRIRIETEQGSLPEMTHCTLRFFSAIPLMGACGLGLLWMLVDSKKMALQDRVSKSRVIELPKGYYDQK